MHSEQSPLRVAFVAGTLGQGGAEKQLLYAARALDRAGVDTRVYSFGRDEFYDAHLRVAGIPPIWVGRGKHPIERLAVLAWAFRTFKPHVIQAAHTYMNLYAAILGRWCGAISVGALRNSVRLSQETSGRWTRWLISMPTGLVVNSQVVLDDLVASGLSTTSRTWLLPNALDLTEFEIRETLPASPRPAAVLVGRLIDVKRVDCFVRALAMARTRNPSIRGLVVGDGPERPALERLAAELELTPAHLEFLGSRDNVPGILRRAAMLVLSSDDEGCPNVVLEAMASGLPVIATPAGEARVLVRNGETGYVVPFGNVDRIAECMVRLSLDPDLRRRLGTAGRRHVRLFHGLEHLADRLLDIYLAAAQRRRDPGLQRQLALLRSSGPLVSRQPHDLRAFRVAAGRSSRPA